MWAPCFDDLSGPESPWSVSPKPGPNQDRHDLLPASDLKKQGEIHRKHRDSQGSANADTKPTELCWAGKTIKDRGYRDEENPENLMRWAPESLIILWAAEIGAELW